MKQELQTTHIAQSSGDSFHLRTMSLRTLVQALALSAIIPLLASCGGSTEVEGNNNGGANQNGKVARDDAVRAFEREFYAPLSALDRCGQCHTDKQAASDYPFVDLSDVNKAYDSAINYIDEVDIPNSTLKDISGSAFISKIAGGHQTCWESDVSLCADQVEAYIDAWINGPSTEGKTIELVAPEAEVPGNSKTFPADSAGFAATIHPILTANCSGCHTTSAGVAQPFFADPAIPNADAAYAAAKPKINLNTPENSNFVLRLKDLHNCWSGNCDNDAQAMLDAINDFINGITVQPIDPSLTLISRAMTLNDAIIASGGNRVEDDLIALWDFKEGSGIVAKDSSGVLPLIDLDFNFGENDAGEVNWVLGNGVQLKNGGYLSADTTTSAKLSDRIKATNSFTIEAWVIPGNVTQEDARIINYTSNELTRNFAMSQSLYNYEFFIRSGDTASLADRTAGKPSLMTDDADEDLQATLQHVVMTYDPVNGQRIYVNGIFTEDVDQDIGGSLSQWSNQYSLILGGEAGGDSQYSWNGTLRMVAVHDNALTQTQITQNFEAGVGQKYFMLFHVGLPDQLDIPGTFVMFEVEQFDNTAYLFSKPKFISLLEPFTPAANIPVEGIRIAVNGSEPATGQAFGNIVANINSASYTEGGQLLSSLGTVIPVDQGPLVDQFFLTFEKLGSLSNVRVEANPPIPVPGPDAPLVSDIGVKTFDEINASLSTVTGIPVTNSAVESTYAGYKQQLPAIENISAFLASHQMAVAQLAMSYCNVLVTADAPKAANDPTRFFKNFDFTQTAANAFAASSVDQIMEPLLSALINIDTAAVPAKSNDLTTQPDVDNIKNIVGSPSTQNLEAVPVLGYDYESLVTKMTTCGAACPNTQERTKQVVTAMCAATLGSALTIIQ